MSLSADSQLQVLHALTAAVDPTAARLRLSDDRVAKVTFLRVHDREAFSHTSVYLPPRVRAQLGEVKELANPGTMSSVTLIGLLDRVLDAPIRDAEQSITVVTSPAEVAQGLDLPTGTPTVSGSAATPRRSPRILRLLQAFNDNGFRSSYNLAAIPSVSLT